jgi:hypothetical protein
MLQDIELQQYERRSCESLRAPNWRWWNEKKKKAPASSSSSSRVVTAAKIKASFFVFGFETNELMKLSQYCSAMPITYDTQWLVQWSSPTLILYGWGNTEYWKNNLAKHEHCWKKDFASSCPTNVSPPSINLLCPQTELSLLDAKSTPKNCHAFFPV